jgi:transcriptional regulator GlxA family with amidase domain
MAAPSSTEPAYRSRRCRFRVEDEDTIVAVGGPTAHLNLSGTPLIDQLCRVGAQAKRVTSVCTGAFLLGAAGSLDERRATTHWRYADLLTTLYPKNRVDADKIYIREDNVWTSAGMSAGIDFALAPIEDDFDARLAKDGGGQSLFSSMLKMDP